MTIYNKSSSVLKIRANDSNIRTKKMNDCKINKLVSSYVPLYDRNNSINRHRVGISTKLHSLWLI